MPAGQSAEDADEVTERLAAPALREEPRGVDRVPRHVWHAENVGPVVPAQAPEGAAELEIAEVKHRGGLTVFPVVREKPARHEPLGQDMMIDDGLVGVHHLPAGALDSATEVGIVVLEDIQDLTPVDTVSRKLLSEIMRPLSLAGAELQVTASIGISVLPDDAVDASALMKHADTAMYAAKQAGKNAYRFYASDDKSGVRERTPIS